MPSFKNLLTQFETILKNYILKRNYHRITEERLLVKFSTKLEKNEQKMRMKKTKLIFPVKERKIKIRNINKEGMTYMSYDKIGGKELSYIVSGKDKLPGNN